MDMFLLQSTSTGYANWPTIIFSMLGGGVIASIITFIANHNMKAADFRYDYRKYVLEKRKKAYEAIEAILSSLKKEEVIIAFMFETDAENLRIMAKQTFDDVAEIQRSMDKALTNYGIWLSPDMGASVRMLAGELKQIWFHAFRENVEKPKLSQYHRLASCMFDIYFKDIMELDDIKKFKSDFFKSRIETNSGHIFTSD